MSFIEIATPFNVDIEFETPEFHRRLFAYCIDFTLIILYLISMFYLLFGGLHVSENSEGFILLVLILPIILYTLLAEIWLNGQTLGKKALRIKVVSLDGGEPRLEQYLLRWFLRFYEWGFIVFSIFWQNGTGILILISGGITCIIIIAVTKKSQRLGDIVAGTVVVNTKSRLSVDDTIFVNVTQEDYKVKFPEVLRLSDRDINTIKSVLTLSQKNHTYDMANRVAGKVKDVLKISSDMYASEFLEKILEDYNYLSTRE